jgi:hypothetical protein
MPYDEVDEALDEMFESDEADEGFDEANSWSRPRPKVASGKSAFSPRPTAQYVTQTQLQTALAKVAGQISTNSSAINKVGSQVSQVLGTVKKEAADRKKDSSSLKNNLSQTQQMAAILPLLTQSNSLTLSSAVQVDATGGSGGGPQLDSGTTLPIQTNTLNTLLPLLLMTGIGDGSGSGGGLFGGSGTDNSSMMMLALVLALGNK